MARGQVTLNSKGYSVVGRGPQSLQVTEETIAPFGTLFRTQGVASQTDLYTYSSKIFTAMTGGFGRKRIPSDRADDPAEYRRFWDSTCDTRFEGGVWLPLLEVDSVETGLEVVRASAVFRDNLWALWLDDTGQDVVARKYVGSTKTWTAGGSVFAPASPDIVGAADLSVAKTYMLALLTQYHAAAPGIQSHLIYRSTDGATWGAASTQPTANQYAVIAAHDEIDPGLLAYIGGEAVVVVDNRNIAALWAFYSTDQGDTWTQNTGVEISTEKGVLGLAVYPGIDDADKLYIGTSEGLWEVDTSPATWTTKLVFPMDVHTDNCRRMTVHNGALWFAGGVDNNSPAPIYRMTVSGGTRVFESGMGLNVGDGVPSDLLGPVRWMKSVGNFLFISVGGGAASRNARVLCHNGEGWHSVRRHATANQKIQWIDVSSQDDGTPRLHYAIRTATATSDTKFLAYPLTNRQSGVTFNTEATGYVDYPESDGGMPTVDGAILQLRADAVDLSADATGEYINADYGVNGAARTTDLGNFLSGTAKLDFASGAGVQGKSYAVRANLHRDAGNTTDSPHLRSLEIDYLKQPEELSRYTFTVDIEKTAGEWKRQVEDVITALQTAEALRTLPAFSYGSTGTKYVKVRKLKFSTELRRGGTTGAAVAPDTLAQRGGYAEVVVEEVID